MSPLNDPNWLRKASKATRNVERWREMMDRIRARKQLERGLERMRKGQQPARWR